MHGAPRGWLRRLTAGAVCLLALGTVGMTTPAVAAVRPCSAGLVVLTFDDGPSPTQTPRLVRILEDRRVPATFFMVGNRVRSAPAVARLVQRSGFGIANHTWSHPLLTGVPDRTVHDQLAATARELRRHGVAPGPLMRPPYGGINPRVARDIHGSGLIPVMWTADSMDWSGGNARQIADRVLSQLRPHRRNVVLQHDGVNNSPNSVSAVPRIIDEARRRGFCFTDLNRIGLPTVPRPGVRATLQNGAEQGSVNGTEPVRVTLTLDRPTTREVSLRVRTEDFSADASQDYLATSQRVTFPAGATRRTLRIRVLPDAEAEGTQVFRVHLEGASGLDVPRPRYLGRIADGAAAGGLPTTGPAPGPPSASPAAGPAPEPFVLPFRTFASWLGFPG